MKRFKLSTEVLFSEDAIDALLEEKDENAVLITDKFMVDSGMADIILKKLSNCNSVSVFDEVIPDPPMDLIERGIDFLQDKDCDVVVALGGGSSIDAAKAIVFMARKIELAQNPESTKKIKLIALPTTSGTGSEVTQFAGGYRFQNRREDPSIDEPDAGYRDPRSGTGQISASIYHSGYRHGRNYHALEAMCPRQPAIVLTAWRKKLCRAGFLNSFRRHTATVMILRPETKMHRASCLAGMAFSLVNLGVNHGIAHALGAIFHIPHGRANALVLPHVIYFNADMDREAAKHSNDSAKKYQKIASIVGLPAPTVKVGVANLISEINRLLKYMDRPMCMSECASLPRGV